MIIYLFKQNILKSFQELGYSQLDYFYPNQIQGLIQQMNGQEQFDPEYLQQIIDQCKTTSKGQIKIEDFIDIFLKAEVILVKREQEIKNKIIKNKVSIKGKNKNDEVEYQEIFKLQQQNEELGQEILANNIGLTVLRKPFIKNQSNLTPNPINPNLPLTLNIPPTHSTNNHYHSIQPLPSPSHKIFPQNIQTYTWILQLSVILFTISLPYLLYYNNFMNILLLGMIVLNIISGYFCKSILRIWMCLLVWSVFVDIAWYLIGARYLYNYQYKDWPHSINLYLKLSVALNGVVSFGKLIIAILLVSEYNTDQNEKKKASFFGFIDIQLSHDQQSRNLFRCLNQPSKRLNNSNFN